MWQSLRSLAFPFTISYVHAFDAKKIRGHDLQRQKTWTALRTIDRAFFPRCVFVTNWYIAAINFAVRKRSTKGSEFEESFFQMEKAFSRLSLFCQIMTDDIGKRFIFWLWDEVKTSLLLGIQAINVAGSFIHYLYVILWIDCHKSEVDWCSLWIIGYSIGGQSSRRKVRGWFSAMGGLAVWIG